MKKQLLHIIFLLFAGFGHGQNLVPNPSFEEFTTCPDNQGQINYSTGWTGYAFTPDYYNSCSSSLFATVPNNYWGIKLASDGNAYAGVYTYLSGTPDTREFMAIELDSPLEINGQYDVSFKTNLCLRVSDDWVNKATNGLGVLFSTVPYDIGNPLLPKNFAHVYSSSIITDTTNWTTISGSIVADSAYRYLIIGNHFDDSNTDTISFDDNPPNSYYIIDEVSVIKDTSNGLEGDNENTKPYSINFSKDFCTIITVVESQNDEITIYDFLGQRVLNHKITKGKTMVPLNSIPSGLYFFNLNIQGINYSQKLVLTN